MKPATLALLLMLLGPAAASAQIEWRVSVKFLLDAGGSRPATGNLNTNAEVQSQIDLGNAALAATGRGYQLRLVEIVDLAGASAFSNMSCAAGDRDALDLIAHLQPSVYAWRSDAINVYVTHASCAGICSFPSNVSETIVLGQAANSTSLLHEIGHYMDLCHTQGCPCGACDGGGGVCDVTPGDDGMPDTLPDLGCWDQDDIAQNAFGVNYAAATTGQQDQVDDVFFNIMSYHSIRDRLTESQMDRMTDLSNGSRSHVATGTTYFVDPIGVPGFEFGTSLFPFRDVDDALAAAGPGDIVLLRGGVYAEPASAVTGAAMLRSSRGNATLR